MEYGSQFDKPPINTHVYPGSWSPLHNNSSFIIESLEFLLDYIKNTLHYQLQDTVNINLFTSGAQIVSGINIYLEFRIIGSQTIDVQALINDPSVIKNKHDKIESDRKPNIDKIYITDKKIFK